MTVVVGGGSSESGEEETNEGEMVCYHQARQEEKPKPPHLETDRAPHLHFLITLLTGGLVVAGVCLREE